MAFIGLGCKCCKIKYVVNCFHSFYSCGFPSCLINMYKGTKSFLICQVFFKIFFNYFLKLRVKIVFALLYTTLGCLALGFLEVGIEPKLPSLSISNTKVQTFFDISKFILNFFKNKFKDRLISLTIS